MMPSGMQPRSHRLRPVGLAFALAFALTFLSPCPAATAPAADEVFLFSFFRGNGEAGVYLAASEDGLAFTPLNGDQPVCPPADWPGQNLTRDPSILYHDGTFYLVWTSSWEGQVFGWRTSTNLVQWSDPVKVTPFPISLPADDQPGNVWAPEVHWDPAQRNLLILWSSTTPRELADGDGSENSPGHRLDHRIYATRTVDGGSFTPATRFFDPGFSVIDAFLAYDRRDPAVTGDDRWVMVFKHEQDKEKNLRLTFAAPDFSGGWSPVTVPVAGPHSALREREKAEGPCLLHDGDRWLLYWDAFANGHPSVASSPDLIRWTDLTGRLRMPAQVRHGTVFKAPRSAVGFP